MNDDDGTSIWFWLMIAALFILLLAQLIRMKP